MKEILVKIKNLSIITIIASFVIGIVLLAWPDKSITVVSILTGATTILLGVTAWISYFAKEKSIVLAVAGTVCIIVGLIICIKYQSIIAILLFIFGVFITISGAVDLITSFYSKSSGIVSWGVSTFLSIAVLILGVVIMINPFSTSVALVRLVGAGLVGYAIVDLVKFIQIKKAAKEIQEELKNIEPPIINADAYEVDDNGEIDSDAREV